MVQSTVGASTLSRTYGPLLSTTLDKILSSGAIQDNVYDATPTLDWFRGGGRIKVVDGGERIRIPIMTGKNNTFKWYSDYEILDVTPQAGLTTAFFNWKQGAVSVSISGNELRQNSGTAKIADLMKEKIRNANNSLADNVATGIFSDGTGSSSKQLTGLSAVTDTTPATTSFASINPATNTSWRNKAVTSVGAAAVNLIPNLRSIMNQCSQGREGAAGKPDFVVTTRTVHESAEALVTPRIRYQPNPSGGADLGVDTVMFKGAKLIWDDYCTSGRAYVLSSPHIMLFIHSAANFAMSEEGFQKPIDQDALTTQVLVQLNMATNNRRKHGVLDGIT